MSGDYDPSIPLLREMLALSIMGKLEDCGFNEADPDGRTKERVFTRPIDVNGSIEVRVYTTIVGQEVRNNGKDAIRVCATYTTKDNQERGLVKATRVHRMGNIEDIVERMYQRMRETWKTAASGEKCNSCGAPKFTAKSGNQVCAEICWRTPEQKKLDKLEWAAKRHARKNNRVYRRRWA